LGLLKIWDSGNFKNFENFENSGKNKSIVLAPADARDSDLAGTVRMRAIEINN